MEIKSKISKRTGNRRSVDFSGILEHIKPDLNQYQYPLMDGYVMWGVFKSVMDVENTLNQNRGVGQS